MSATDSPRARASWSAAFHCRWGQLVSSATDCRIPRIAATPDPPASFILSTTSRLPRRDVPRRAPGSRRPPPISPGHKALRSSPSPPLYSRRRGPQTSRIPLSPSLPVRELSAVRAAVRGFRPTGDLVLRSGPGWLRDVVGVVVRLVSVRTGEPGARNSSPKLRHHHRTALRQHRVATLSDSSVRPPH